MSHAGQGRQQHAGPEIGPLEDGEPAHHGAQGHDALDAEIQHAGPLAQQLAQGAKISGVAIRSVAAQKLACSRMSSVCAHRRSR